MSHQETVEFDVDQKEKKSLPRRFYTVPQIAFGVFLGGPLAGFFLMRRNFVAMGEEDKASAMGFWGILSMFPFLFILLLLPENVPGAAIQGAVCGVFGVLAQNQQQAAIRAMEASGAVQRFTHWRMLGASLVALLVTFIVGVLLVYGIEMAAPDFYAKLFPEDAISALENTQVQAR